MGNARVQLANAVQNAFCSVVNDLKAANAIFSTTFDVLENSPLNTPLLGAVYPILQCDNPIPPPSEPPFTGGQCFTTYDVSTTATLRINVPPSEDTSTRTDRFTGQINGLSEKPNSSSGKDIVLNYTRPDGVQQEFTLYGYSGTNASFTSYGITGIVRVDGLPDNCGDPPVLPVPPPDPGSNVRTPTVTYDDKDGNPITISPTIVVGIAYINASAQVIVPIEVNFNAEVSLTANLNISTGGITFSPGSGSNKRRYPDDNCVGDGWDDFDDGGDLPPSAEDPSTDEPKDEEDVIVAVIVTVTSMESGKPTQILQSGNPDIYAPYLGFVNFLIKPANTFGAAWTTDIPVKNRRHFIKCPWDGGAIAVDGTPLPGVEWALTPVRKKVKTPTTFV